MQSAAETQTPPGPTTTQRYVASRIADHLRTRQAELAILAVVALLLIVSVAVRPAPEPISLVTQAGSVRMHLAQPFLSEGSISLRSGGLVVGRIDHARLNDGPIRPNQLLGLLARPDASISLDKIAVGSDATLRISREGEDCLVLSLLRGRGELSGQVDGDSIAFGWPGASRGQSDVTICPTEPLRLAVFGVTSFDFDRRFDANASQSYSMSTISELQLGFPDLGLKRDLIALDGIVASGVDPHHPLVIDAPKAGNLRVAFAGRTQAVSSGTSADQHNLMPLLLEHLLGSSPIAFVLTGFGFFWGTIWSVFRFARPSR